MATNLTNDQLTSTSGIQSAPSGNGPTDVRLSSPVIPGGIQVPVINFVQADGTQSVDPPELPRAVSLLASSSALREAEVVELTGDTGAFLYYPWAVSVEIGDVFYLRERSRSGANQEENGVIVQVIEKGQAEYSQSDAKTLWRLLTSVRASELQRSYNEPAETVDLFLAATFKVRAAIVGGAWTAPAGQVVTRNVDIFPIDPARLTASILRGDAVTNVNLGAFKAQPVIFAGQGFDKVNLITGMRGAGKSHITKGIIDECRQRGMSAVVFDINSEYGKLPGLVANQVFRPGENFKFRLDRTDINTFVAILESLAKLGEKTEYRVRAELSQIFKQRKAKTQGTTRGGVPQSALDLKFLKDKASDMFPGNKEYVENMRGSYLGALETLETYNLFMTSAEIQAEEAAMKSGAPAPQTASLRSAFYGIEDQKQAGVIVFDIGGILRPVQEAVVRLVRDGLKELCDRQCKKAQDDTTHVPLYPSVYFEEAHMYMEEAFINNLIPVVRHLGMNLFFVTNTPGALPDSVFRLLDNLIMTQMVNQPDIAKVATCGLCDKETIESFAPNMPDRCAMVVSAKTGITKGFPLVFNVRDFGLPQSGQTRSMWQVISAQGGVAKDNKPNDSTATPGASDVES